MRGNVTLSQMKNYIVLHVIFLLCNSILLYKVYLDILINDKHFIYILLKGKKKKITLCIKVIPEKNYIYIFFLQFLLYNSQELEIYYDVFNNKNHLIKVILTELTKFYLEIISQLQL